MSRRHPLTLEQIKAVKQRCEAQLMRLPNVTGVGIGLVDTNPSLPDQATPGIIITVAKKDTHLSLPDALQDVPVSIMAIGTIRRLEN